MGDKLDHDERIRLEAITVALQCVGYPTDGPRTNHVLVEADKIETFIILGELPEDTTPSAPVVGLLRNGDQP